MTPEQSLLITAWQKAVKDLASVKPYVKAEQDLRAEVIKSFFPAPKEGTNRLKIFGDWELNLSYKIDRKVDEAALPAILSKLQSLGHNVSAVIVSKPSLALGDYRTFQELQPAGGKILDEALIIKPGSHSIELVPPKDKK